MAPKNQGKTIFDKKLQMTWLYPGVKYFVKIALSHTVSKINAFYAEIQNGGQNGRKTSF